MYCCVLYTRIVFFIVKVDHPAGGQGREGVHGDGHVALRVAQVHGHQGAHRGQVPLRRQVLQPRLSRGMHRSSACSLACLCLLACLFAYLLACLLARSLPLCLLACLPRRCCFCGVFATRLRFLRWRCFASSMYLPCLAANSPTKLDPS